MGKSGASCLRIMSCGRDHADEDYLGRPEVKPPVDKHRWSFKRRSSRHQIPDDCVISEPMLVSVSEKETPDADYNSSHLQTDSYYQERLTVAKCLEDTPPLSPPLVDTDISDSLTTSEDKASISESVAVVIQSAARAYLAGKDLQKRRSVVKLQAAARGYLARRQAVSTLRCIQAIVKMQALVRARRMRLNAENLAKSGEADAEIKQDERFNSAGMESFGANPKKYSSMEILLRNGFARLLLESSSKTKPIYISCDPLRSESSWKWLERWMVAGSTDLIKEEQNVSTNCQQLGTEGENGDNFVTSNVPSDSSTLVASCSTVSKSDISNSEGDIKALIDGNADFVESSGSLPERSSATVMKGEQESNGSAEVLDVEVNCLIERSVTTEIYDPNPSEINFPSDATLKYDSLNDKISPDSQNLKGKTKMIANKPHKNDLKQSAHGSKKSCYEFAAAMSKSEEPPLFSSSPGENFLSHKMMTQKVISDCRTEIPFTSTLDSQEGFEHTNDGNELAIRALEGKDIGINCDTDNSCYIENTIKSKAYLSTPEVLREKMLPEVSDGSHEIGVSSVTVEQWREPLDETTESVSAIEQQAYRSSPKMSPRSHANATESLGTPSSQISTNAKITKTERRLPNRTQKTKLASKKAPANRDTQSNVKNISDLLPDDQKNGKEDNSPVIGELEDTDQGHRASISNSLPSYMQTTESTRAKFHSSNSPRACPDENDRDKYARKMHSLPTGNGTEDLSSHTQQEASQVQQSLKRSATHSPKKLAERKWVR